MSTNAKHVPPAVSPDVARSPCLPSAELVTRLNEILSAPWSSFDRTYGRFVEQSVIGSGAEGEAVIAYYSAAGWHVTHQSYQRDPMYVFKPAEADAPKSRRGTCACGAPSCDLCHG